MVGEVASVSGGRPSSRSVALVTGPMEMRSVLGGSTMPAAERSGGRWLAVEELVKVTASGKDPGALKLRRSASTDVSGMTVR